MNRNPRKTEPAHRAEQGYVPTQENNRNSWFGEYLKQTKDRQLAVTKTTEAIDSEVSVHKQNIVLLLLVNNYTVQLPVHDPNIMN